MSPSTSLVAIQSARFTNAFLRMDGSGVVSPSGGGSGIVNCQFYDQKANPPQLPVPNIGNDEVFELIPLGQYPHGLYALRSVNYSSAFLRIDGLNVTQREGGGSGVVNCQYYASGNYPLAATDYEMLLIGPASFNPATYYIRSFPFPSAFLRMDGGAVGGHTDGGSGTVNCQYYPSDAPPSSTQEYEVFHIITLAGYTGSWA